MWILRLNMSDRTYQLEDVPEAYTLLGGRGITSAIVHDEVPPTCHPLGPNNKLVFAPGVVTGTSASTSARLSVGCKSPLTGGIKEANVGSGWAPAIARMRIKAIVVEGQPEEKGQYWTALLTWKDDKPHVEMMPAKYVGEDLYEAFPKVFDEFGKVNVAAIGAAGEFGYGNSGICFNDMAGRPSRYAGRGGVGAVMGSKGLKFIIVDHKGAPGVEIVDQALFNQGRKKLSDALRTHDLTKPKGALNTYGTAVLVNIMNEAGGLPAYNFSSGRFDDAPNIAGEAIFEGNKERTGKELYNHACSPGCIIQCSNTWHKPDGTEHVSCVNTNRPGPWVPTAVLATWTKSLNWFGYATSTASTPSRPVQPSRWLWRLGWPNLATVKRPSSCCTRWAGAHHWVASSAAVQTARPTSWAWYATQPSRGRVCPPTSRVP
jgi:aldehyde:ferredoxin oxidoreductase